MDAITTSPAPRFDAPALLPGVFAGLVRASKHADGPVPARTLELVAVRVSQRNGCAFCCDLHGRRAEAAGADRDLLRALPGWRDLPAPDAATRAALSVAEELTTLDDGRDVGPVIDAAAETLGPEGLAQVVGVVAAVSAWNRLLRAAGTPPDLDYA